MPTEKLKPNLIRPGTLYRSCNSSVRREAEIQSCGFLDDFTAMRTLDRARGASLKTRPNRRSRTNALSSHRRTFGAPMESGQPTAMDERAATLLDRPWFMGPERMKGFCLRRAPWPSAPVYLHRGGTAAASEHAERRTLVALRDDP